MPCGLRRRATLWRDRDGHVTGRGTTLSPGARSEKTWPRRTWLEGRRGAGRAPCYGRLVSAQEQIAAAWRDVLEGEELAYLGTEPSRAARLAPVPAELEPRVRDALAATGVTAL